MLIIGELIELTLIGVVVLMAFWAIINCCKSRSDRPKIRIQGSNCVITGGSQGIGKGIAETLIKEEAKTVIIVARNEERLKAVAKELKTVAGKSQSILYISCDVTKKKQVAKMVNEICVKQRIDVDVLITCHGKPDPVRYFFEQKEEVFEELATVNYLGVVYVLKKFLPFMYKSATFKNPKHVCVVSSALALCTCMGWSAYTPSKFALRGLVETLENEFIGFPIHFYLGLPMDTQTPGFEREQIGKPMDCKKTTEEHVFTVEQSVKTFMSQWKKRKFYVNGDFGVNCLITMARGFTPFYGNPFWELLRIWLFGPAVMIVSKFWNGNAWKYVNYRKGEFDRILNEKEGMKVEKEEKNDVVVDVEVDQKKDVEIKEE